MEPIFFNSSSQHYKEFSNFYVAPFILDESTWNTVEHYFQAQKFPTDPLLQQQIREAKSATVAKRLGRTRSPHFSTSWDMDKEIVMERALRAKFTSHEDLKKLLKSTNPRPLVEKSWWDSYWGSGKTGTGKNRMGYLLEKIRNELLAIP